MTDDKLAAALAEIRERALGAPRCERRGPHLYGRWLEDGKIMMWVLREKGGRTS